MTTRWTQITLLMFLAIVFTFGLTFVTVELPYIIDGWAMGIVSTPDIDSHASDTSVLQTDLYISHYRLRLIGYTCFGVTVLLIVAGFATRRTSFAALGAMSFMLPVFAQFAGVMFFLAGLGVLNLVWLPFLDISLELQQWGRIIRVPYDLLMWLFGLAGVSAYWPLVYLCIGGGLLIFFLGTFAWLSAKLRGNAVADFWVYRVSRHPQHLGWILWSYGVYLLLLRGLYPKRSWGIDASLPWLLSTMVLVGVAMLEELSMRNRWGEPYDAYRNKTPFLMPLPRFMNKVAALPLRVLSGRRRPERKWEIVAVLSLYTVLLVGASAFFYGGGLAKTLRAFKPAGTQQTEMAELVIHLREEANRREQFSITRRLMSFGEPSLDHFVPLLKDEQAGVRILAAQCLGELDAQRAVPALIKALEDPLPGVRREVLRSLGQLGSHEATASIMQCLDDPDKEVQARAAHALAELGVESVVDRLIQGLAETNSWTRCAYIESLGKLGSVKGVPAVVAQLCDSEPRVRRAAVIALMRIGAPETRGALAKACQDDDWEVRVYAAEALKRMRDRTTSEGIEEGTSSE